MTHRHALFLSLLCCLLLPGLASQAAEQTFAYKLPHVLAPAQPVSLVRVELSLYDDFAPGQDVGGVVTGARFTVRDGGGDELGTFPAMDGAHTLSNGDQITLRGVGTETVFLRHHVYSLYAAPNTDPCALNGSATDSEYQYTLTGWTGISTYRMTGYSAASVDSCTCSKRRVKNGMNWTEVPPGDNLGRFPMDIALVVDRSGSMSSSVTQGMSRWMGLRSAVAQFIAQWKLEGMPRQTGAVDPKLGTDRLGLFLFGSNVVSEGFRERGLDGNEWNEFTDALDRPEYPSGQTAMGAGLEAAFSEHSQLGSENDLTVVLMTDGMQNVQPLVKQGLNGHMSIVYPGTDIDLTNKCTPILTIPVGNVGAPWTEDLERLSQQTAGTTQLTLPSQIGPSFISSLVDALKGNTPSLALQEQRTMPPGGGTHLHPVTLDSSVENAIVVLGWVGNPNLVEGALSVRLLDPNGNEAPTVANEDGFLFSALRVDLPDSGPPGVWTVEVNGGASVGVPYNVSVIAEESVLDFVVRVVGEQHPAGEPLEVEAVVSVDGEPADPGDYQVSVEVEGPVESLGTVMSEYGGGYPDDLANDRTAYEWKLDDLLEGDEDFAARTALYPRVELPLTPVGGGRFQLPYTDTSIPGRYRFRVVVTGPDELRRVETLEAHVVVLPDVSATATGGEPEGDDRFVIHFTPRDLEYRRLGPGYENTVRVFVDWQELTPSTDTGEGVGYSLWDNEQMGTYTLRLWGVNYTAHLSVWMGGAVVLDNSIAFILENPQDLRNATPADQTAKQRSEAEPLPGRKCGASGGLLGLFLALPLLGWWRIPRKPYRAPHKRSTE
ncbi:VWA domain-containing protein [Pyxidicoccus trucidator]|uniref:VWA domain-containing protein n=1 Tax=Pyxidicoccus trucidator TaxID=2709662 RepID=UPI0013DCDA47|nr:VWA domain-containing protein [Pyxidicoccus trucidator]